MTNVNLTPRVQTLATTLARFFEPGECFEIRCLKPFGDGRNNYTQSGTFVDPEEAAAWAISIEIDHQYNVYFGLNPRKIPPSHDLHWGKACKATDVEYLRWMLVDFDPVRGVKGQSSSDEEKRHAENLAMQMVRLLCQQHGWPLPIMCDSGNGYHLLFRINLKKDLHGLITQTLRCLSDNFSTPQVEIDAGTNDIAQITRCYGTLNRKGQNTPDRPHRYSRAFDKGGTELVSVEQLQEIPILYPPKKPLPTTKPKARENNTYTGPNYDIPLILDQCGLDYAEKCLGTEEGEANLYELVECPWADEHSTGRGGACIIQFPSGGVTFKCHHNGCSERKWEDFKTLFKIKKAKRKAKRNKETDTTEIKLRVGFNMTAGEIIDFTEEYWPDQRTTEEEKKGRPPKRGPFNVGKCAIETSRLYRKKGRELIFQGNSVNKGKWRVWEGRHWKVYDNIDFTHDLAHILGENAEANRVKNLINTIEMRAARRTSEFNQQQITAFNNCQLTIDDNNKLKPITPNKNNLNTHLLPIDLKDIPTPNWQKVLERIMPDEEDQQTLQEMLGYCFFPCAQLQVFFVLLGEGFTGKSTITSVLIDMLGEGRWSSIKAHQLVDVHSTSGLVDSWVNIDGESEYWDPKSEIMIKQISGGDPTTINEKFMPIVSTVLQTKLLFGTNALPRMNDKTTGLWSRLVLIPFKRVIPENERVPIKSMIHQLRPEYPGILWWALQGLKRILKRGTRASSFTQSNTSKLIIREHRDDNDPFRDWLESSVNFSIDAQTPRDTLFQSYNRWLLSHNYRPTTSNTMGRRIKKCLREQFGETFETDSRTSIDGKQRRCYNGVELID